MLSPLVAVRLIARFQDIPPPSYQPRLHVIGTLLASRRHFPFLAHLATRVLVSAYASRILRDIDLRCSQDLVSNGAAP